MYLELSFLSRYISSLGHASGRGLRAAGALGWGVCGYPAPSLCRRGLTFPVDLGPGSATGIGIRVVTGAFVARQRWRVEDGVPEQHELHRHGPWRAARRIPALGETVFLADRAVERLHQLRVQFPGLFRRHVEHARGTAQVVLEALRPGRRRGE